MKATELCERFDYLADTRARFFKTFEGLGWDEFSKDRGATWGSMLGIFLHILDVEEGWLQYAARMGSVLEAPDRRVADYLNFDTLSADNLKVSALTREYLATLKDEDLDKVVLFRESTGTTKRPLGKILTHAMVDELAHVGEWVCLLWQLDVKPPYIDWLDYNI
jgi:uncharacterized damage-inducible protein DinB